MSKNLSNIGMMENKGKKTIKRSLNINQTPVGANKTKKKLHKFASWPTVHLLDNLAALGIILRYTSRWNGFIS